MPAVSPGKMKPSARRSDFSVQDRQRLRGQGHAVLLRVLVRLGGMIHTSP
jgi:hypothetical protein